MKILISACLLGENVKYDGTNNSILKNSFIKKLLELDMLIPICPEVEGGLTTPRQKAEIINKKVKTIDKIDVTKQFLLGAQIILQIVEKHDIKIAILKSKSPSCGKGFIYDGTFNKALVVGDGMTTEALKKVGVEVFSEEELEKVERFISNERKRV